MITAATASLFGQGSIIHLAQQAPSASTTTSLSTGGAGQVRGRRVYLLLHCRRLGT